MRAWSMRVHPPFPRQRTYLRIRRGFIGISTPWWIASLSWTPRRP